MRSVQNKSFVTSGTSALIVPNQQTQLSRSLRVRSRKNLEKNAKTIIHLGTLKPKEKQSQDRKKEEEDHQR